jgi:hypothetical protein
MSLTVASRHVATLSAAAIRGAKRRSEGGGETDKRAEKAKRREARERASRLASAGFTHEHLPFSRRRGRALFD